jgi:hypothetical protein
MMRQSRVTTPGTTEALLRPWLAARLCFAKALQERLSAQSPLFSLSEDLVRRILSLLDQREPFEVLGTACAGAHTGDPRYYRYHEDSGSLELREVCWLHVCIGATQVPPGRWSVQLHLTAGRRMNFELKTTTSSRPSGGGKWHQCCSTYSWGPYRADDGMGRGVLTLGEVTLAGERSEVRVQQQNTNAGAWKSGITWHKLRLVPLPLLDVPEVEPGWALGDGTEGDSSSSSCSTAEHRGRGRCTIM